MKQFLIDNWFTGIAGIVGVIWLFVKWTFLDPPKQRGITLDVEEPEEEEDDDTLPEARSIAEYGNGNGEIQQIDIDDHLYLLAVSYSDGQAHMIHAEHCQCKERNHVSNNM